MICPKCGHNGDNRQLCEACGIVFAKYAKRQEQTNNQPAPPRHQEKKTKSISTLLLLCLVAVAGIAAGKFLFTDSTPQQTQKEAPQQQYVEKAKKQTESHQSKTTFSETVVQTKKPKAARTDIATEHSSLKRARNATVLIESPWGLGSGVLLDERGHIVTNRHVVEFSRKQLEEVNAQLEKLEKYIKVEGKTLKSFKKDLDENKGHKLWERYNYEYQQRKEKLDQFKQNYDKYSAKKNQIIYSSVDKRVDITFPSGEKITVWDIALSDKYDLALLSLRSEIDTKVLPIISSKEIIHQGDKVYTIGNPSGLRLTMTSGIVSGFRQYTDKRNNVIKLIQTDAPINAGNSGGPLVDEKGRLIGINTAILKDTEGIGFALPTSLVWEEFAGELNGY